MIKKILLVDDEEEIRDFLKEFFEARSYQVFTAANLEEARNGLSKNGGIIYLCNYLSERGNVHKLVQKKDNAKIFNNILSTFKFTK
jgi:DNA-binding response OmpR family regulator